MRADLHVHSSASDGTDPPAEVMRRAARAGLDVVALTDHDTVAGHAEARRALAGPRRPCCPAWNCPAASAAAACTCWPTSSTPITRNWPPNSPHPDDRVLRARAMVRQLEDLGVGRQLGPGGGHRGPAVVGRPHIARAMAASGAIASPREAFTRDWIGDGGRAYVGRYALDPVRAIGLVRDAGGVAVLAHPRAGRDWGVSDEEIGQGPPGSGRP